MDLNIVKFTTAHVFGHQDVSTPYDQLSRKAQMNVRMDSLAKIANTQVKNGSLIPPASSHHPLGFLPVSVNNRQTHHQLSHNLYSMISEKITHQWWLSKGRYAVDDIGISSTA